MRVLLNFESTAAAMSSTPAVSGACFPQRHLIATLPARHADVPARHADV